MNKEVQRIVLQKIRASLSSSRKSLATNLATDFLKTKLNSFTYILSFYPLENELNLMEFNTFLLEQNKLLLPKTLGNSLEFYKMKDLKGLVKSSFHVLEPSTDKEKKITSFSNCALLVPGLGFSQKYRLGYGKGFYDRFISENRHLYKIGIGFKEQYHSSIITESHDEPLDEVLLF